MTRKQHLRTCGNLMQLVAIARTSAARQVYRRQYELAAARLGLLTGASQ